MNKNIVFAIILFSFLAAEVSAVYMTDSPVVVIEKVRQDSNPAVPGDVVTLHLEVENLGAGEVANLEIILVPIFPFSLYGNEAATKTISSLDGYQHGEDSVQISYDLLVDGDAIDATMDIELQYTYDSGGTSEWYATTDIEVLVENPRANFDITGKQISENLARLFIVNSGDNDAQAGLLFIKGEGGQVYSTGKISAGNMTSLEVSIPEGIENEVQIEIQYTDSAGIRRSFSDTIYIYTSGVVDVEVFVQEATTSSLTLAVVNAGNFPLYAVSVGVPKQTDYVVSGASNNVLGNLDAGDYSFATFSVGAMNVTGKSATSEGLRVEVSYTDGLGERRVVTKTLAISGTSTAMGMDDFQKFRGATSGADNSYLVYGFAGLVVIVGGYFAFRRRRVMKSKK